MNKRSIMNNSFDISGKTFLLTGAAGQIGKKIINYLINNKSNVFAIDLNYPDLNKLKEENYKKNKSLKIMKCDITKKNELIKTFKKAYDFFGNIDGVIANAGVSVFEDFLDRNEKSIDFVMDVNMKGTILTNQIFINFAKNKKTKGVIVNVASHYGIISPDPRIYKKNDRKNSEVYGATKAGVIQMTKYFSVHAAKFGVRVNSISPGGIYSGLKSQSKFFKKNYSNRCPVGRLAYVEEIIGPIVFLLSDASSYVNGHNLVVDGGMSSW